MSHALPFFDPYQLELRRRVRSWVEANLFAHPLAEKDVEEETHRLVRQLGKEGFNRHAVPKAYGGARESVHARDLCILREELARGSALADTMFAMHVLGSYPITLAGTEEQKRRYLPAVATGEAVAAFAVTEPQAGSDLLSMETRAVRVGRKYRLSGVKCLISNAGIAHTYVVFAVTGPDDKAKGQKLVIARGLLKKGKF